MEFLALLFVGRPLTILAVASLFLAAFFFMSRSRFGTAHHPNSLLVPAVAWALYAAWEWMVMVRTPEANIRVDLLVVLPVLMIISIWFTVRSLKRVAGMK